MVRVINILLAIICMSLIGKCLFAVLSDLTLAQSYKFEYLVGITVILLMLVTTIFSATKMIMKNLDR
jgi:hypothetical protein